MMASKKENKSNRHHPLKTPSRYRLSFFNDNTFNEVWTIKLSRRKVVILTMALIFALTCAIATIIVITPLKTLLPGYLKSSQREETINNTFRIDSLIRRTDINNAYIGNLRRLIAKDVDSSSIDTQTKSDTIATLPVDSLLVASAAEKQFVKQFEEKERFNLSILNPITAESTTFYPPVNGATVKESTNDVTPSIAITTARNAPISAIYRGTVIDVYHSPDTGYCITIQHPNGFISKYLGIGNSFVSQGDIVNTGTRIGMMPSRQGLLTIELWHKGTALNPKKHIAF